MRTPALFERRDPPHLPSLFLLSGPTPAALLARVEQLHARARAATDAGVDALAADHARDAAGDWRLAIVAETRAELHAALEKARARLSVDPPSRWRDRSGLYLGSGAIDGRVAVLFPGQGSQFPGMTRELCASIPGFRRWFDALDRAYVEGGAPPPSVLAFPADDADVDPRLFALETGAQLGLAASLALHETLLSMGIGADVFAGHSNGEHAALIAAGVLAFPDLDALSRMVSAVALEAEHLPEPTRPERVVAVTGLGAPAVTPLLEGGDVFIGVDNCPTQCLIAGLETAVDEAAARIAAKGGIPSRLPFTRAHHTPLFADWSRLLGAHYTSVDVRHVPSPSPVFSCLHARRYATAPDDVRAWLTAQWSGRVRFRETIEAMYAEGIRTFVEAGPDNRLTAFVHDTLRGRPHRAVSASWSMRGGLAQLSHCAAELFAAGLPVRAAGADASSPAVIVQREFQLTMDLAAASMARVGARIAAMAAASGIDAGRDHPILGRVHIAGGRLRADRVWDAGRHAFLQHHSLARFDAHPRGLAVMPFTMMMALAAEAAAALTGAPVTGLREMRAANWLALDRGTLALHVEASQEASGVRVVLSDGGVTAFEAIADCGVTAGDQPMAAPLVGTMTGANGPGAWSAERLYREYLFHGPQYAAIARITRVDAATIDAELITPPGSFDGLDPLLDFRLLDCAGQLAAAWRLERTGEKAGAFPFSAARLRVHGGRFRPAGRVTCRGSIRENALGILESSFDFRDDRGTVIASLERFEQRVMTFPEVVWSRLFAPAGGPRPALDQARPFLQPPGSIWGRALAHVLFEGDALDRWYALPDAGARLEALVRA